MTPDAKLLSSVFAELFQAEKSGSRHPLLEAERLGDASPALPMQLVAAHATRALSELEVLSRERDIDVGALATALGRTFSAVRNRFADLGMRSEQSYRYTLLGIRHGIDLVRLLRELAREAGDELLVGWTDQWLEERLQLVTQAEAQLAWFARCPEHALRSVKNTFWARATVSASSMFGKLDAALTRSMPKRA